MNTLTSIVIASMKRKDMIGRLASDLLREKDIDDSDFRSHRRRYGSRRAEAWPASFEKLVRDFARKALNVERCDSTLAHALCTEAVRQAGLRGKRAALRNQSDPLVEHGDYAARRKRIAGAWANIGVEDRYAQDHFDPMLAVSHSYGCTRVRARDGVLAFKAHVVGDSCPSYDDLLLAILCSRRRVRIGRTPEGPVIELDGEALDVATALTRLGLVTPLQPELPATQVLSESDEPVAV